MAHRYGIMKDDLFFDHFKSVKQKESDFFLFKALIWSTESARKKKSGFILIGHFQI